MQTIHRGEFGHIFRPWKKAAQRRRAAWPRGRDFGSMDQPAEKDEVQNLPKPSKTIPFYALIHCICGKLSAIHSMPIPSSGISTLGLW
jgi:hypothetical protein